MKEEKFPNIRKPPHWPVYGEFWNLRGNITGRGKKSNNPQITCLLQLPAKK